MARTLLGPQTRAQVRRRLVAAASTMLVLLPVIVTLGAFAAAEVPRTVPAALAAEFPVVFTERGLPNGSAWTVTVGSHSQSTAGRSLVFYEPNGTYPYSVGSLTGYVPSPPTGSVTVQGGNNTIAATLSVPGAKPWGGTTDPQNGDVYMAYQQKGNLSVLRGASNGGSLLVGKNPVAPIFDPLDGWLYSPNSGSNDVTILDPSSGAYLGNVTVGNQPVAGAFDPANGLVYVVNSGGNSVSVLNGTNASAVATIPVGTSPRAIAFDPLDGELYVTDQGTNALSVITGTPGQVVLTIPLASGSAPYGVAYDAADGELYVTDQGSSACAGGGGSCLGSLFEAATGAYNGTFAEGPSAAYPAYDSENGLLYVPNNVNPGTLTVLGTRPSTPVAIVPVGANPSTVAVDAGNGYVYSANFGSNTISVLDGHVANETVTFVPRPPAEYAVNFTESGLPIGTNWSVVVNGTRYGTAGTTIGLSEANGSFPYTVGSVAGYQSAPSSGTLAVQGGDVATAVVFSPLPPTTYPVAFVETGLPSGTNWSVNWNGTLLHASGASLTLDPTNGTYGYNVSAVPGYVAQPASGSVVVNGSGTTVPIAFSAAPNATFSLSFDESGLPSGEAWSVTVGSWTANGIVPQLIVQATNGTFAFTIGPVAGFSATPSSGVIQVDGLSQVLDIHFANATPAAPAGSGPGGAWGTLVAHGGRGLIALVVVVALVLLLVLFAVRARRRRIHEGSSIPALVAAAGFPSPLGPTEVPPSVPTPAPTSEPELPAVTLPGRRRPEPPPKPDWSEE